MRGYYRSGLYYGHDSNGSDRYDYAMKEEEILDWFVAVRDIAALVLILLVWDVAISIRLYFL